jgi:hypothetical protein
MILVVSVMWTVWLARSMTGFPTFARSAYGLVKYPTFSAALLHRVVLHAGRAWYRFCAGRISGASSKHSSGIRRLGGKPNSPSATFRARSGTSSSLVNLQALLKGWGESAAVAWSPRSHPPRLSASFHHACRPPSPLPPFNRFAIGRTRSLETWPLAARASSRRRPE